MEVHQPPCQLAQEDNRSFETNRFALLLRRNDPIKMNCYCGKTQKRQKIGTHVFALLYAKESRFATVPS